MYREKQMQKKKRKTIRQYTKRQTGGSLIVMVLNMPGEIQLIKRQRSLSA